MDRALEQILQWAKERPYWEQLLLDELLTEMTLEETTVSEAAEYLLASEGLAPKRIEKELPTLSKLRSASKSHGSGDRLLSIRTTQNVNALLSDQPLEFAEGLTVVYGENGAGKSGYARILGAVGFCRHQTDILPNLATGATDESEASILFTDGGEPLEVVLNLNAADFHLPFMKVFDNESVPILLDRTNAFSFTPLSLEILTLLSNATDRVRSTIELRAHEQGESKDYCKFFEGDSPITEYIASLSHETNLQELKKVAAFSEENEKQLDEIEDKITLVRKKGYEEKISHCESLLVDLSELEGKLMKVSAMLSYPAVTMVRQQAAEHRHLSQHLQDHKIADLSHAGFNHTGTKVWSAFVQSAYDLGVLEYPPDAMPTEAQPCLLCQQPLSTDAIRLYCKLWEFLLLQSADKLGELRTAISDWMHQVKELDITLWRKDAVIRRAMKEEYEQFEEVVSDFVDQAQGLIQAVSCQSAEDLTIDKEGFHVSITTAAIRSSLNDRKASLVEAMSTDKLTELEAAARHIKHKKQLSNILEEVVTYVKKLKWSRTALSIGGTTRPITEKYNSLFDELVTSKYKKTFTTLLNQFSNQIKVSLSTRGRKGKTVKRVHLDFGNEESPSEAPKLVLSEGEQKAVALSDFLSEAIVDEGCNCIVLDDPVNSFDYNWIDAASSVLCRIASKKQVIVFTHSVIFLHHLTKWAQRTELKPRFHWVQKLGSTQIGVVSLDESPSLEAKYKTSSPVRESIARASKSKGAEREAVVVQGFGQLRTCYEVMVYRELFNGVVSRWEERIDMGRLRCIVVTDQFVAQIDNEFRELSRYIEGHSHSDQFSSGQPALDTLKSKCEMFEKLRKQIRTARNTKAKQPTNP